MIGGPCDYLCSNRNGGRTTPPNRIITTREDATIQHKLAPIVTLTAAGAAAVMPHTKTGARFPFHTSPFEVIDQRPFEDIPPEHLAPGAVIENFEPSASV